MIRVKEPTFDIFSGASDKDALWVEAVEGWSQAGERMEEIAAEKPGKYFLFSAASHSILARIETCEKAASGALLQRNDTIPPHWQRGRRWLQCKAKQKLVGWNRANKLLSSRIPRSFWNG
jgi:hypothetical protein